MSAIPTVRIVNPFNPADSLTVNLSDFDPAVHTRWTTPPPAAAPPPGTAGATAGSSLSDPAPERQPARKRGR